LQLNVATAWAEFRSLIGRMQKKWDVATPASVRSKAALTVPFEDLVLPDCECSNPRSAQSLAEPSMETPSLVGCYACAGQSSCKNQEDGRLLEDHVAAPNSVWARSS
jgi:hypothetical protein